jgi:cyclophilin family peptidyl-prolyl cis-trans isomerase
MRRVLLAALIWSASLSGERFGSAESLALLQPESYRVRLETTRGPIVVEVHRDWAPHGAARFRERVTARDFDDNRFFRVVKGQWAQFEISGDPAVANAWRTRYSRRSAEAVQRPRDGAFAFAGANARTAGISLGGSVGPAGRPGFAPFGRVVEGMDVADALNSSRREHRQRHPRGQAATAVRRRQRVLDREFPGWIGCCGGLR